MLQTKSSWRRIVLSTVAGLTALAFIAPLLWLIASAFRSQTETFGLNGLDWHIFWPYQWTTANFESASSSGFLASLLNSLIVAVASVAVGLLISAMAAFALAALNFRGKSVWFAVIVAAFIVPFEAVAIPLAISFRDLGLANSFTGLILPGIANGLAVFVLRQYFLGIPGELREAAIIDGAGWWRVFTAIYVPLGRPALIGAGLTLFLFQWNSYLWPSLVASDPSLTVAPVTLGQNFGGFLSNYGTTFAETLILCAIPSALVLIFQRFYVESIAATGTKD